LAVEGTESSTRALHTLSLHDALPISTHMLERRWTVSVAPEASSPAFVDGNEPWTLFEFGSPMDAVVIDNAGAAARICVRAGGSRSEEHTSELQSREKLVCRLLLEKKK